MYDFIKFLVKNLDPELLLNNPILKPLFKGEFDHSTGEIKKMYAKFKEIEFIIYGKTIIVKFSPHKYYNSGFNYNDFTISQYAEVLSDLLKKFGISPENTIIQNLEIGVNIIPPIRTNDIIRNIFFHERKEMINNIKNGGQMRRHQHQRYEIKVYNKGEQNKLPYDLLRIEVHYNKMKDLNEIGIYTLNDLLKPEIYYNLYKPLVKIWNELLLIDSTIRINELTPKYQEKLKEWKNKNNWFSLIENSKAGNIKYNKEIINLRNITKKYSDNIQAQISELIQKKWKQLTDIQDQKGKPLTDFSNDEKINEKETSNHLYKLLPVSYSQNKVCPVTGIDISLQKDSSKFLCDVGIRNLFQNDISKFIELKEKRLSKKWHDSPLEIQFREIAHSVRNESNNLRNNNKRAAMRIIYDKNVLFDSMPYIRIDKLQIAGII